MLLVEHRSMRMKSERREEDDAATAAISMGGVGTSSVGISPRPHQGHRTNERTENFIRKQVCVLVARGSDERRRRI